MKKELFHAWQDAYYPGGISQYAETGRVNIEFEAKVFKDLIMQMGTYSAFFKTETDEEKRINSEYGNWIESVKEDISILQDRSVYNYWLDLFNEYNPAYTSPISNQLTGFDSLNNIISNSNCF